MLKHPPCRQHARAVTTTVTDKRSLEVFNGRKTATNSTSHQQSFCHQEAGGCCQLGAISFQTHTSTSIQNLGWTYVPQCATRRVCLRAPRPLRCPVENNNEPTGGTSGHRTTRGTQGPIRTVNAIDNINERLNVVRAEHFTLYNSIVVGHESESVLSAQRVSRDGCYSSTSNSSHLLASCLRSGSCSQGPV